MLLAGNLTPNLEPWGTSAGHLPDLTISSCSYGERGERLQLDTSLDASRSTARHTRISQDHLPI
jgi:hypothetical protein